jgi:hypothetical protein
MDAGYEPSPMETRTLFGLQLEQKRNDAVIDKALFTNITSKRQDVSSDYFHFLPFFCVISAGYWQQVL